MLEALSGEPVSTSELYERLGYPTLMRIGLIPFHAFRETLAELEAAGFASSAVAEDGSTLWRRRAAAPPE